MKKFMDIKVTLSILKQGKRFIAYSPALDLSTSGRSQQEVKKRFTEAALLFLEGLYHAGTMRDVLQELGWQQVQKQWMPPQIVSQEALGVRMPIMA